MSFQTDIKNAMRDCILKILWPKKDIYNFFKNNGCTASDLKTISHYKDLKRYEIIDTMFSHLSNKPDNGLGPYRSSLRALIEWSHFDSYYFENLKKLNKDDAIRSIDHLKQLQEIRDHKIRKDREKREQKEKEFQKPKHTLDELKNKFLSLMQGELNAQKRGYELEFLLQEIAKNSQIEVTTPFRVNGEQIDGAIKFEGENYILEAKWQDKMSANESVYQFAYKAEKKMYGRGLFISINGYSENVIKSIIIGSDIKVIFIDGEDLIHVLEGLISFSKMLDNKVRAAQNKGNIYINSITCKNKTS